MLSWYPFINFVTANFKQMKYKIPSLKVKATALLAFASALADAQALPKDWNEYSIPSVSEYYLGGRDASALKPNTTPFSINMTINGDPRTRMGFAWFTNQIPANDGSVVQIVAKANATEADFANAVSIPAAEQKFSMNYMSTKNVNEKRTLEQEAKKDGISLPNFRNYTSHKAVAENLTPDTDYSFRVGKEGAWSGIGSFRTAPQGGGFTFNYTTDTQANTLQMFDISAKTINRAMKMFPNALFNLNTGDFIETASTSTTTNNASEWEWERWFATMQEHWLTTPLVPVLGNHDMSVIDVNFHRHFNTDTSWNAEHPQVAARMDGANYSFVYGNTLFMALNYEEYKKEGYLETLGEWITEQVAKHPDVKWKVLMSHRNVYTGASHHADTDQRLIREKILPYIEKSNIDVYFQGHDHVYEVIGPVSGGKVVEGSVTEQETVKGGVRENMTGKLGGTYNVYKGTLYLVNNSAGKKKYEPKTEAQMKALEGFTNVKDYYKLFTGRFGQTGEPTFSNVIVTDDMMKVATYTVSDEGDATLFDEIKIIKKETALNVANLATNRHTSVYPVPASDVLNISAEQIQQADIFTTEGKLVLSSPKSKIDISKLTKGSYVVRVVLKDGSASTHKILVN